MPEVFFDNFLIQLRADAFGFTNQIIGLALQIFGPHAAHEFSVRVNWQTRCTKQIANAEFPNGTEGKKMFTTNEITLRLIDCRIKRVNRNFFQVDRRNRRCLLSSDLVSGSWCGFVAKCDISDDNVDTGNIRCLLFSTFSAFNLFWSSESICADWLQPSDGVVGEFASLPVDILVDVAELLIFTRRDKRNRFLGIENARRTSFFFSLIACVALANSLLMPAFGLAFVFAAVLVSRCCCCCCWLIWSIWSSLGIVYTKSQFFTEWKSTHKHNETIKHKHIHARTANASVKTKTPERNEINSQQTHNTRRNSGESVILFFLLLSRSLPRLRLVCFLFSTVVVVVVIGVYFMFDLSKFFFCRHFSDTIQSTMSKSPIGLSVLAVVVFIQTRESIFNETHTSLTLHKTEFMKLCIVVNELMCARMIGLSLCRAVFLHFFVGVVVVFVFLDCTQITYKLLGVVSNYS